MNDVLQMISITISEKQINSVHNNDIIYFLVFDKTGIYLKNLLLLTNHRVVVTSNISIYWLFLSKYYPTLLAPSLSHSLSLPLSFIGIRSLYHYISLSSSCMCVFCTYVCVCVWVSKSIFIYIHQRKPLIFAFTVSLLQLFSSDHYITSLTSPFS